jgi:aspartyl protease family protein
VNKFAPFVVITIAIGAAVGWLGPDPADGAAAPAAAPHEAEAAQLAALQQEQWLTGEFAIPRADDGHFYAEVSVDGTSVTMLVDTGATMIALTGDDAEAMGIVWNDADVKPVARGASGEVHGVSVTLDSVQLGDFEARGVAAVVIPEGLGISLLGQSFLSRIERVEMEQDRMVLASD